MNASSLAGLENEQLLISREEAETVLLPHVDRLNRCIEEGWNAWKTDYAQKSHILRARARAAIVYDEIVYRAIEAFSGLENVKWIRRGGSLMIFIGEHITLRFKKIRKSGRCSNISTEIQGIFLAQMQLPGVLDGTLVHAGYQLDELQQAIVRKAVVCQLEKKVVWQIQLTGEFAEIPAMPPAPPQSALSTEPRFIPKEGLGVQPASAVIGEKE